MPYICVCSYKIIIKEIPRNSASNCEKKAFPILLMLLVHSSQKAFPCLSPDCVHYPLTFVIK